MCRDRAFGNEAYILTGYFNLPKIFEITLNNGFDKRTGKRQIVAQLNLRPDEQEGYFCIDTEDGRAYKIVDRGDYLEAVAC